MGCQFADDRTKFYSQEKNAIETFLKYEKQNDGIDHWTETCGPTSLWNGCEAMGKPLDKGDGIRAADRMFVWLNAPQNWSSLTEWRGTSPVDAPASEVQGWFPVALKALFGVESVQHDALAFDDVKTMVQAGHAVQLWRKVGHYVVAVDYDQASDSLVYWDSFHLFIGEDKSLTDDNTGGFRRLASRAFFAQSFHDSFVEILP